MVCEKGRFSAHAKQPDKEKTFFSAPRQQFRTAPKLTSSNPFSNTACCCELAAHLLFFVKTSVLRLHYGNPFAPIQSLYAGVLQAKPVSARTAGNFCKVTSGRALNRPRSPEVRKPLVYFWFFSYKRKARKTSPSGELRGSANLESAHRSRSFAPQQLKPF